MTNKHQRALDVKCPTCRSNPGVPCDSRPPCGARVKLAGGTADGRVDRLEKGLASAYARIETLETALGLRCIYRAAEMLERAAVKESEEQR